jgi:glycosyltransferase involved in cell wall biosynthesis
VSKPPILILADHIDGLGGEERIAHALAGGLAGRGYEVALRGIRPSANDQMDMTSTEYSTGFMSDRAERPAGERPWPAQVRTAMRREAGERLENTLAEYGDGLVICMQVSVTEHLTAIGIEKLLNSGTRIIGQYRSSYQMARATTDFARLSQSYRQLDKFLLLTDEDAMAFQGHNFNNTGSMPSPLSMYPMSVDTERQNIVVAIARYDANKQLDHALQAWAMIAADFPDWRFELYGEGPERDSLQQTIDSLGISGSAALMGITDDAEGVLLRSRAAVLSSRCEGLPVSRCEGLPVSLTEALVCGVPAVAYECCPGVRAIVTDGITGYVVSQNHVAGLARSLRAVMEDGAGWAQMSAAARASASRFSVDTVMDRWEDLIARVMR